MNYLIARSNLVTYAFLWEKVKTVSESIAASDLKVGRCRFMKVCELKVKVIFLPYINIFQVLYVLCFTGPRYQVSILQDHWSSGPMVCL